MVFHQDNILYLMDFDDRDRELPCQKTTQFVHQEDVMEQENNNDQKIPKKHTNRITKLFYLFYFYYHLDMYPFIMSIYVFYCC